MERRFGDSRACRWYTGLGNHPASDRADKIMGLL